MLRVNNHISIACENLQNNNVFMKIKNNGYNIISSYKNKSKNDICIPTGNNLYIYTPDGYFYIQDKLEISINLLINIINTTYNEKIKIYKYKKNDYYYIFCIYTDLWNSLIENINDSNIYIKISPNFNYNKNIVINKYLKENENISDFIKI